MYAFVNGQWAEVYVEMRIQGSSWGDQGMGPFKTYLAVDSRISRDRLILRDTEIYQTKPNWMPAEPIGTKIRVKVTRRMRGEDVMERSGLSEDALWGEIEEAPTLKVYEVEIVSLSGFDATHRCGYCEEYSATNPDEKAPCKGCKRCDWQVWDLKEKPVLGLQKKPDWVRL